MANRRITDLTAASQLNGNDLFIITDTDSATSQSLTGDQVIDFVNANADIPTTIADIAGLSTTLNNLETGKADVVHTHQISDIVDLQTELNTKFDATTAGVVNNVVIIGNGSVDVLGLINERVADITGVSPTDARIPGNVTSGNFLQFSGTDGTIGEVTATQFKADLDLNNVDNTADLNKPVSTAQAAADDLRVLQTAYDTKQTEQDNAIAQNTVKIGITNEQASAIIANTSKNSYPSADSTKLAGIEALADVTDTANVWSSVGISTEGRTNYALTERGVFVEIPDAAGNVAQAITSVTTEQVSVTSGGGMVVFNISGIENNNFTVSIVNTNPANWITNASLDATTGSTGTTGEATITATVPSFSDLSGTRSFQLQVQVEGAFQPALTSDVVTQYTASQLITGIALSAISFGNDATVEAITVSGIATEGYSLELFDVNPAGWITSGALSASTGVIGMDGTDSSNTISIPSANNDTVNRSFRLRARSVDDTSIFVETATITQVHTQSTAAGNLMADAGGLVNGNAIDFTVNVSTGDAPFTAVLNQHATDATISPIQTLTFSDLNTVQNFTTLTASDYTGPTEDFYVHISDNDGDVVVEMETVTLANNPPTGNISQTMGATSPANGDTIEFTAAFTDAEGDALTYQWQTQGDLVDTQGARSTDSTLTVDGAFDYGDELIGTSVVVFFNAALDTITEVSTGLSVSGSSVVAIWADGEDHSTVAPSILVVSPDSRGSFGTWTTDFATTANTNVTFVNVATYAWVQANATLSSGTRGFGFPAAQIEVWENTTAVPYQFTDIDGETNATYSFVTESVIDFSDSITDVSGTYDSSTAAGNNPNSDLNGVSAFLAVSSISRFLSWGADSEDYDSTTIAILEEDGESIIYSRTTSTSPFSQSVWTSGIGTTVSISSSMTDVIAALTGSGDVTGDTSESGSTSNDYTGWNSDRVGIWANVDEVPMISTAVGSYRVAVTAATGDTTTVFSNEIELT